MITSEKLASLLSRLATPQKGDRIYGYVRKNGCPVLGQNARKAVVSVLQFLDENPQTSIREEEYGKVLRLGVIMGDTNYHFTIHGWRD